MASQVELFKECPQGYQQLKDALQVMARQRQPKKKTLLGPMQALLQQLRLAYIDHHNGKVPYHIEYSPAQILCPSGFMSSSPLVCPVCWLSAWAPSFLGVSQAESWHRPSCIILNQ